MNRSQEEHTLFLSGKTDTPILAIATDPIPLRKYLQDIRTFVNGMANTNPQKATYDAELKIAETACDAAELIVNQGYKGRINTTATGQANIIVFQGYLSTIATQLAKLPDPTGVTLGAGVRPPSDITYGGKRTTLIPDEVTTANTVSSDDGISVNAKVSANPGGHQGSGANVSSKLYLAVNKLGQFRRGHLLNHHLHGTGDDVQNLIPITASANGDMENQIEEIAKKKVLEENEVLEYSITAHYPPGDRKKGPEGFIPDELNVDIHTMQFVGVSDIPTERLKWTNWSRTGGPAFYSQPNFNLQQNNDYLRWRNSIGNPINQLYGLADNRRKVAKSPDPIPGAEIVLSDIETLYNDWNSDTEWASRLTHYSNEEARCRIAYNTIKDKLGGAKRPRPSYK